MVVDVSLKCCLNIVGPSGVSGVKQTILWSVWGNGVGVSLQDVMSLILEHDSVMGWVACCWSDDALSSKNMCPKYQFPCGVQDVAPIGQVERGFHEDVGAEGAGNP